MKTTLMESLVRFTHGGQRKIDRWTAQHRCVEVVFADAARVLQREHRRASCSSCSTDA